MASKKEEAGASGTDLVTVGTAQLPSHLLDRMEEHAGLGNSQDQRDSVVPFLAILQKGSPQVNEQEAEYISGAKAGMLFNTATGQVWDGQQGIVVIACGFQKNYVEWKPNRGGYVDTHPFDIEKMKAIGARKVPNDKGGSDIKLPNGNLLTETAYTFVIAEDAPMVIGASSTGLGPMRAWMSYRRAQKLPSKRDMPSYAKFYKLTTVWQKNDKGDWYNWKFEDLGFVLDAATYDVAEKFAIACAKGEVVIGRPDEFGGTDDVPV